MYGAALGGGTAKLRCWSLMHQVKRFFAFTCAKIGRGIVLCCVWFRTIRYDSNILVLLWLFCQSAGRLERLEVCL